MATYLPISILLPLLIHGRVPSSFSIVRSSICVVWQTSLPILQSCRLIWLEICSTMSPYKLDGNNLHSCWCNLVLTPSSDMHEQGVEKVVYPVEFFEFWDSRSLGNFFSYDVVHEWGWNIYEVLKVMRIE